MTAKTMTPSEAHLRAAFTALAERYEQAAATSTYIGQTRAAHITRAAEDIRTVLATGQLPAYLRTNQENAS